MLNEDLITDNERKQLLNLISQCYKGIFSDDDFNDIVDEIKALIPFEYWGLVFIYFDSERINIEELSWFKGIDGFEEAYIGNKLFYKDPISLTALEMTKSGKMNVQFWAETFANFSDNALVTEFFEQIMSFEIANYNGYTVIHQESSIQGIGFSITGPSIQAEKDPRIVYLLDMLIPHIAHVTLNGKIGKLKDLTDKQFRAYQLLKAGLTYDQIGSIMKISNSGVVKHFDAIRRKLGINNKKELNFGFDSV